jgi:uncharacterized protein with PIN domain
MIEMGKSNASDTYCLKCPSCLQRLSQRVLKLFDPNVNRSVQLFQCDKCRKHVWDDDAL